jgi:hypothetical protein
VHLSEVADIYQKLLLNTPEMHEILQAALPEPYNNPADVAEMLSSPSFKEGAIEGMAITAKVRGGVGLLGQTEGLGAKGVRERHLRGCG